MGSVVLRHGVRWASLAASLLVVGSAQAQTYVRPDCQPLIAARGPEGSSLTGRWYRRFWTGDCGDLHGCLSGAPNWNEVVGKLVARSPAPERPKVLAQACRLGPLIGLEWTKPNKVRRIDTHDLRGFKSTLEDARDVLRGLADVEAQVRAKAG